MAVKPNHQQPAAVWPAAAYSCEHPAARDVYLILEITRSAAHVQFHVILLYSRP